MESTNRASFFDDDDLNIHFDFQKPNKNTQKDLNQVAIIKSNLLRQISPNKTTQQGCYALHHKTLAYYKSSVFTQPESVLDLTNVRLNLINLNEDNSSALNKSARGFSLTKNGNKLEFFSEEDQIIDNWMNALKYVCVLTNFHDEYKALKMIGKGSFAKVYLVESKINGKNFAVKAFTKESVIASNKSNAKPSMWNEIDIMRSIDHENIIKLYEVYETEKSLYLVLELIQGKSLQEVLKKGGFKDNDARTKNVISSILEALAYLATKGIMHRDLKPDNILIDKGDKVKIVDFGLATFIDVPEYIFKKCGTPGYIAPEVFKYDPKNPLTNYNDRCDVFSAGCILYYMVFGNAFFEGPNASEILKTNRKFGSDFQAINLIKQEMKNANSKHPKEALDMLTQLLDFDQRKRIAASQSLTLSYIFTVVQQKLNGSYDFYQSGGLSPTYQDRRGSLAHDLLIQQMKNSVASPTPGNRFELKDSLYLDLGKPELNGKIDTLTNGSANNSLLINKADSMNMGSPRSASPFARQSTQHTSTFRLQATAVGSNNPNVLKQAIFRNMQSTEDGDQKIIPDQQQGKHERRYSAFAPGKFSNAVYRNNSGQSDDNYDMEDMDEVSQENPQLQKNVDRMKFGTQVKHPSKLVESSRGSMFNSTQRY